MAFALKTLEAEAAGGGTRSFLLAFCRAAMCLKEHMAGWSTRGVREGGREGEESEGEYEENELMGDTRAAEG